MNAVAVRAFVPGDVPALLRIQCSSREAAQWSEDAYRALGRGSENAWVAEGNGAITGFLIARVAAAEMEILNLAVDPTLRRQGIGAALLCAALLWAAKEGALRVFLEVRLSNVAAQKFYGAYGFSLAGARRNYYHTPDEDAVVFVRSLDVCGFLTSRP